MIVPPARLNGRAGGVCVGENMMLWVCGFCFLTILWLAYLLFRSRTLRLPGRLGICWNIGSLELCGCVIWIIVLLGIALWAVTQDEQGVWALLLPVMFLSTGSVAVLSWHVRCAMAFTVDGFLICGLFGAPRRYAWADVMDCQTIKTVVPRSNKIDTMYVLKLSGREIALYGRTAGGCAFIKELRRHKPLMHIPVPGRGNQ